MKKIVTFAALASGALALAACSGETAKKTAEEPAAAEAAPAEAEAAPAAAAADPAAEEELDPTGNPIGMDKPAEPADAMAAE
jgi:predicted flap endonuclease-1-like 5' DNA nuclease